MKKEKAITLISLVITIVVLIILAGVVIYLSIGNNGIFTRAKYAKEKEENAQIEEKQILNKYDSIISGEIYENKKIYAEEFKFIPNNSNWNVSNLKEALDYFYNY